MSEMHGVDRFKTMLVPYFKKVGLMLNFQKSKHVTRDYVRFTGDYVRTVGDYVRSTGDYGRFIGDYVRFTRDYVRFIYKYRVAPFVNKRT
jgi:hypothetical protein